MALAHNGNLTNAAELREELRAVRRHLPDDVRHRSHRLHHHPGARLNTGSIEAAVEAAMNAH